MGQTAKHNLPYPENTDPLADVSTAIQALANGVDVKLIQHTHDGTRLDATGTEATDHPAGLRLIAGRQQIQFNAGVGTLTFPGGGFAGGVLALVAMTLVGTSGSPVGNSGNITKTSASLMISGYTGTAVLSYFALGY